MTRYPDFWTNRFARLTSVDLSNKNLSPDEYQYWLNAYFSLLSDRNTIKPEGPISVSIRQSKTLFGLRPLWAMSFEEKRFKARRLVKTSMASGVFEAPTMRAWAFQRELIHSLDGHMILVERTMDASGSLQKLALMRSNSHSTVLQVEQRDHRKFRLVPVSPLGRRTNLSGLLFSPRSIAANVPPGLI